FFTDRVGFTSPLVTSTAFLLPSSVHRSFYQVSLKSPLLLRLASSTFFCADSWLEFATVLDHVTSNCASYPSWSMMAKQGKKLSKPQPAAKAARPKSLSGRVDSNEAPLLPHERVVSSPNPSDRPHATPCASNAATPSLRRANSAPSCLQTTSSVSAAVSETTPGILFRGPSKKLQKKPRLDEDEADEDDFAPVPAATPTMIKDAQLALGLGPREAILAAVNDMYHPIPSLRPNSADDATWTANTFVDDDDDENYDDDDWQPPSIAEVQHPINVFLLKPREIIGRGALMPQLKRWQCCKCGYRTHYENHICSCLECCHNRCEDYCTALEPA
ncbi:hypothetical protein IWZ01DRAFT_242309, partial [Phyllosticta capitalensis]